MIEAMFRKCTSPEIIVKYNSLLNSLKDSMITNMSTKTMVSLVKMQLSNNTSWTITTNSLTGTGSYDYTYTYPYQELYVTVPGDDSIKDAKEKIEKVSSGEMLESSYGEGPNNVHSVTQSQVNKKPSYSSTTKKPVKTEKPKKEETKKEENKVETPETVEPENKEESTETETPEVEKEPEVTPPVETPEEDKNENTEVETPPAQAPEETE